MEPRTSRPAHRLDAIRLLAEAGVPVGVMMAPILPGLTDHEMPSVLAAALGSWRALRRLYAASGSQARGAALCSSEWVKTHFPDRSRKSTESAALDPGQRKLNDHEPSDRA